MKFVQKIKTLSTTQVVKMTLLLSLAVPFSQGLARKPAVDPVQGISIDQYEEVKPSEDPGFNFGEETRGPANNSSVEQSDKAPTLESAEAKTISWWPLAALPVGLLFLMLAHFKGQKSTTIPENVVPLKTRSAENKEEEFKKAG
ncbi:MAG: hypothetical protein Fur0010_09190 [Bdellovibrio sp.]